jgi:ketosteroid isomerase-like protein
LSDQVAVELERETRRILALLDAGDLRSVAAACADDAQGVDELSRGWRRGREALDAYFSELEGAVAEVQSNVGDLHVKSWAGVGLVTFVLEQTYNMHGEQQVLSAPTSMLFERDGEEWKVALIHSVPFTD